MSKYKKNKAVALKYNAEEDSSPVVIASGYGTVAEHIIDIAEKKGIPVFKDDSAASLLCMLEVGSNIPVELYEVVAAIYCKLIEVSAQIKGLERMEKPQGISQMRESLASSSGRKRGRSGTGNSRERGVSGNVGYGTSQVVSEPAGVSGNMEMSRQTGNSRSRLPDTGASPGASRVRSSLASGRKAGRIRDDKRED